MAKYLLSWYEVEKLSLVIEAESRKEAFDKFFANDYDNQDVKSIGVSFDEDSLDMEDMQ